jgi:NCAIR mutase (PurE)-related protein
MSSSKKKDTDFESDFESKLKRLLKDVQDGKVKLDEAFEQLKVLPFSDLQFAKVDHHRTLRKGFPEVIFRPGKTLEQVCQIASELLLKEQDVMITKADKEVFLGVKKIAPIARYYKDAKIILVERKARPKVGNVLVIAGGTADLPVAEEAALTCEVMGNKVSRVYDVGVAGIHRLFAYQDVLAKARVIIAVAGMEGALPSIIGGLVSAPIIAVPTSIGYGASFQGLAPLLTMLNTCSPGIAVVNIDNGFGAGYIASLINQMGMKKQKEKSGFIRELD